MIAIYPWQIDDWSRLKELRKRSAHALLFRGAKGIGKLDLAICFAQSLLCQQPGESDFPCGHCPSCHWFEQGSHPDYRLLQPEVLNLEGEETESGKRPGKMISVDQIRGLSDFFGMTSHQGGKRVVIIHPAETMNANAANALLKSLEEPSPGLLFILVSHKPQQLLPTILSRCLSFALPAPDFASTTRWLEEQGVKNPSEALAASGFSPLQAVYQDQQLSGAERDKMLRSVRQPGEMDVFALAEGLQKTEQVLVIQWLQQWCYDLSSMKLSGRLRYHPGEEPAIRKLVESISPLNLARLQKHLLTAKRDAGHTLNPKLFFESIFIIYRQLMLE
jgi:DNA polymerase-3 subunit delta'